MTALRAPRAVRGGFDRQTTDDRARRNGDYGDRYRIRNRALAANSLSRSRAAVRPGPAGEWAAVAFS
jgi:hypothetical protein